MGTKGDATRSLCNVHSNVHPRTLFADCFSFHHHANLRTVLSRQQLSLPSTNAIPFLWKFSYFYFILCALVFSCRIVFRLFSRRKGCAAPTSTTATVAGRRRKLVGCLPLSILPVFAPLSCTLTVYLMYSFSYTRHTNRPLCGTRARDVQYICRLTLHLLFKQR